MKRPGRLLRAVAPVATTAAFLTVTGCGLTDPPGSDGSLSSGSSRPGAGPSSESERAKDDALIATLPAGLAAPGKKELAQQIVATAEHSTLDWRGQYDYIEDLGDGNGYTAGIAGFCTGTSDLLTLVERYTKSHPDNGLARYLPALRKVDGTDSHEGLDPGFTEAWVKEAQKADFRKAQDTQRDRDYFDPAVRLAKLDGLGTLGQFVYYDAMVLHGPGTGPRGFYGLRETAMAKADTPAEGGKQAAYLDVFLDVHREAMTYKEPRRDTTRIDTTLRKFLDDGNVDLSTPLRWEMYGETFRVP
ncbi:chitosanase [Streptomyces sp. Qhu-G9]|uniref:chitosanase n=1 Tax=Streptomyces sp. Qhu-G9 TaxID=3452799 RepID=UPI0022AC0742|nr:chitosanase [Streptomyces aurantiacus]WAU85514.1 chitosanase [Streptomyces aurantiacus]